MKKRLMKVLLPLLAAGLLTTSCGDNETYNAGFQLLYPQTYSGIYANTASDSVIVYCLGDWNVKSDLPATSWCSLDLMSGKGNAIYSFNARFDQNETGMPRVAQFTIYDKDHPTEAYSSWRYLQYATRGDGSLGSAALVKTIKSSDGYEASISYDANARPVQFSLKDPEGRVGRRYSITYDEIASQLRVQTPATTLEGEMDKGYQAERLYSQQDTMGYYSQYYANGMPMSMNYAFSFKHVQSDLGTQAFSFLLNGQSLQPDSLHHADSLRYYRKWNSDSDRLVEKLQLKYSAKDNRCQSVDVNQLLLGFGECDPMLLLSMFRYTRSTSILSEAVDANGRILVATELNHDKSVRRMTVTDERSHTEVTYDFEYEVPAE
jgi:hypothetical protein